MNILVIGNGFDLAHGLPTKYGNFLEWLEIVKKMKDRIHPLEEADWKDVDTRIRSIMESVIKWNNPPSFFFLPWEHMIKNNVLIDYFMRSKTYLEKGWIDFETEISNLVQVLEVIEERMDEGGSFYNLRKSQKNIIAQMLPKFNYYRIRRVLIKKLKLIEPISHIDNLEDILDALEIYEKFNKTNMSKLEKIFEDMDGFRLDLENDLNDLVLLLEIYFLLMGRESRINKISPDIEGLDADKVLSFNYTDTYKLYEKENREIEVEYDYIHGKVREWLEVEYDYIHGKVQDSRESNNMVLGINEYLPNEKKDCNIKFIAFKKYYQRIYKGTGNKHKDWIDKIREDEKRLKRKLKREFPLQIPKYKFDEKERHNLYIFGHSLDVTDRDILKNLILHDNVYTTIFYHKSYDESGKDDNGRNDLGVKIANLVKVIGQDELIRRTGGSTKTIEFKLQQDMVERK